ncbi:hypothetical protein SAMN04515656_10329 [Eubacterium aggregans]|uniref:dATP/dGTP diphosphohydrolase N-terminal domain-containing protein n=1 Tax=Eubacterium aggregans TaxID=81409 RepID=A0A1H3Y433_9FIRM|nr:dATP/dGTP diphosphohydrolase domain-containing protein [Eubacterium aggregans]SEA05604.1 hypothetical protein SAMN04515656_10329 [Eubacterium aggregans]
MNKPKFSIKDYPGKYAMHCDKWVKSDVFCRYMDSVGREWRDGTRYIEDNPYDDIGSEMAYTLDVGTYRDYVSLGNTYGYTILEFDDFDWSKSVPESTHEPNQRQFSTGAVRDDATGKGRCDLLPPNAILKLAKHFEKGSTHYGDRNWEKGIPTHSFLDSGMRHLLKYSAGYTDEDHLTAAIWNLMCLLETEILRPEMQDLPARMAIMGENYD